MAAEPGNVFDYSSGVTELLAYIFKKETGQDIDDYGEKYLFAPLGIKHHWKRSYMEVVDTEGGLYLKRKRSGEDRLLVSARRGLGRQATCFEGMGRGIVEGLYRCRGRLQV